MIVLLPGSCDAVASKLPQPSSPPDKRQRRRCIWGAASARIGVGGGQSVNLGNRSSFRSTSMFRPAFRLVGLSRTFATSRLARAQAQRQTIQTPKTGDPPIVHYVRRKIEERQKLQSEVCH